MAIAEAARQRSPRQQYPSASLRFVRLLPTAASGDLVFSSLQGLITTVGTMFMLSVTILALNSIFRVLASAPKTPVIEQSFV
jgi:hypothetical protein